MRSLKDLWLEQQVRMKLKAEGIDPLLDSCSEANWYTDRSLIRVHPSPDSGYSAAGQCFTVPSDKNYKITSAKFYLKKEGSPVGNLVAQLYAMTGTYGTNGVPTGSALAESDTLAMESLTTTRTLYEFAFPSGQQYEMTKGTYYCIECVVKSATTINGSNYVLVGKATGGSHSGNPNQYNYTGWAVPTGEVIFYVYGEAVGGVAHEKTVTESLGFEDTVVKSIRHPRMFICDGFMCMAVGVAPTPQREAPPPGPKAHKLTITEKLGLFDTKVPGIRTAPPVVVTIYESLGLADTVKKSIKTTKTDSLGFADASSQTRTPGPELIPTDLYVCIPRRSSYGAFFCNAWCNLTRKDTGQGISGKPTYTVLDGVQEASPIYTNSYGTGYAGPHDLNPQTAGLHPVYVMFPGDATYAPCVSETIMLKIDSSLLGFTLTMSVTPTSGSAPLTIQVTGTAKRYGNPLDYSIPLDLMVIDPTSTKRMQVVKTVMTNPDGTFTMEYTFTKPGTYSIFVNFLGDDKYRSEWSNGGAVTSISVS